MFVIDIFTF